MTFRFAFCSFTQMCLAILEDEALPLDMFSKILLPSLLNISHDPVPNVRLLLSQVMSGQIIPRGVYTKVLHVGLIIKGDFLFRKTICMMFIMFCRSLHTWQPPTTSRNF